MSVPASIPVTPLAGRTAVPHPPAARAKKRGDVAIPEAAEVDAHEVRAAQEPEGLEATHMVLQVADPLKSVLVAV